MENHQILIEFHRKKSADYGRKFFQTCLDMYKSPNTISYRSAIYRPKNIQNWSEIALISHIFAKNTKFDIFVLKKIELRHSRNTQLSFISMKIFLGQKICLFLSEKNFRPEISISGHLQAL